MCNADISFFNVYGIIIYASWGSYALVVILRDKRNLWGIVSKGIVASTNTDAFAVMIMYKFYYHVATVPSLSRKKRKLFDKPTGLWLRWSWCLHDATKKTFLFDIDEKPMNLITSKLAKCKTEIFVKDLISFHHTCRSLKSCSEQMQNIIYRLKEPMWKQYN